MTARLVLHTKKKKNRNSVAFHRSSSDQLRGLLLKSEGTYLAIFKFRSDSSLRTLLPSLISLGPRNHNTSNLCTTPRLTRCISQEAHLSPCPLAALPKCYALCDDAVAFWNENQHQFSFLQSDLGSTLCFGSIRPEPHISCSYNSLCDLLQKGRKLWQVHRI